MARRMFSPFHMHRSKLREKTKEKFRHDKPSVFGRKLQRRDLSVQFFVNQEKKRSLCLSQLIEMSVEKGWHSTLLPNGNFECRRTVRGKWEIKHLLIREKFNECSRTSNEIFDCRVNLSKSLRPKWGSPSIFETGTVNWSDWFQPRLFNLCETSLSGYLASIFSILLDLYRMKNKPPDVSSMICEITLTECLSSVGQSHSLLYHSLIDCFFLL